MKISMIVNIVTRRHEAEVVVKLRVWAAEVAKVRMRKIHGTGELAPKVASQARALQ